MQATEAVLLLLAVLLMPMASRCFAFQPTGIKTTITESISDGILNGRPTARTNSIRLLASTNAVGITTVSICTAELCKCQEEEGMGAEDILKDLQSRDLNYPINEAPCLGACGGGAMVAIDFEDGSCALVTGLDETLRELGLLWNSDSSKRHEDAKSSIAPPNESAAATTASDAVNVTHRSTSPRSISSSNVQEKTNATTIAEMTQALPSSMIMGPEDPKANKNGFLVSNTTLSIEQSTTTSLSVQQNEPQSVPYYQDDARERMRREAAKNADAAPTMTNPWLNAASYLAKKATEKIFNSNHTE